MIDFFRQTFILGLLLSFFIAQGQTRKYSNDFMTIGVGARALGMGHAVVASQDDVMAGYWNPANLTEAKYRTEAGFMHADYFAGLAGYDFGAVSYKTDEGVLGISFLRFGIDDIQNTLNLIGPDGQVDYSRITFFSTADNALLISYAKETRVEGLSIGGSGKIIYRQIGDFANAWGFGLDFGANWHRGAWRIAAVGKDITTTVNSWTYSLSDSDLEVLRSTGNELPEDAFEITMPTVALGIARRVEIGKNFSVLPEIDANLTFDGRRTTLLQTDVMSIAPSAGLEAGFRDLVYLRLGVTNFIREPAKVGDYDVVRADGTLGLGLNLKNLFGAGDLTLDYALTNFTEAGSDSGFYSNVFSLSFAFGNTE